MFDVDEDSPESVPDSQRCGRYPQDMARPVQDVADAIRARLPGVPVKKLHKLLYYCQAHHLVAFGQPLFQESITAWDMGPVVGQLWKAEQVAAQHQDSPQAAASQLDEAQLNTVGYVIARYGALTGRDLEHLTHNETPWQRANQAREPRGSVRIELEWIKEYFESTDEDAASTSPDPGEVSRWLADAEVRLGEPAQPDDLAELRARLASVG